MSNERYILEARAAQLAEQELEWNELDFVGWKEFRRMLPAVIGLEMSRLDRLMSSLGPGTVEYNSLVRARFELRQFVEGIGTASKESLASRAEHLRCALLTASLLAETVDAEALRYVIHRLTYVHQRLNLVY